ncbi:hypothetical protein [Leifsonia poae]|uniref:hypothetical protein n=1 Tax=Leifsonia poae TaxID=110933 RepID=UPI001CBBB03A|nr:hypothetical protein [Leifsonia poae]
MSNSVLAEVVTSSEQVAQRSAVEGRNRKRSLSGWHFVLFPIAVLFLVPFLQMALASFSPAKELVAFPRRSSRPISRSTAI